MKSDIILELARPALKKSWKYKKKRNITEYYWKHIKQFWEKLMCFSRMFYFVCCTPPLHYSTFNTIPLARPWPLLIQTCRLLDSNPRRARQDWCRNLNINTHTSPITVHRFTLHNCSCTINIIIIIIIMVKRTMIIPRFDVVALPASLLSVRAMIYMRFRFNIWKFFHLNLSNLDSQHQS